MKSPLVSACMIIKNEEKMLPSCLRSIRDFVDEIIVVDTGSSDRSVPIAESFGAQVYHHPWEEHFSRHRNQSIGYAAGNWILIIDADEELMNGSGQEMQSVLRTAAEDVDAVTALVESSFGNSRSMATSNSIRLIRNRRGISYQGRVHNYLVGAKKAFCSRIRIRHFGYDLDPKNAERKFKRTTGLLLKDIEEDPSNPRPHHFLAASYLSHGLHKEAAQEAELAIRLFEQSKTEPLNLLWSLYIASSAYLEAGECEKARVLALKGLKIHPDHLDSHYILAAVSYHRKEPEVFNLHMRGYLQTLERIVGDPTRFGEMVHNTFASRWLLHLFKGILSLPRDAIAAQDGFAKAGDLSPDPFTYHFTLGKLLLGAGELSAALEEIKKSLELKSGEPDVLWILSHVYERLGKPAEQVECIERLLAVSPEFSGAHFQAGLSCMKLGEYDRARKFFQKAYALRPGEHLAIINEALCLRGMGRHEESLKLSRQAKCESRAEKIALLLNLACCQDALGENEHAIESFTELARQTPESFESPVYLSRLFLKKGEVESCVAQCDRLLEILGMDRTMTLNTLSDLGSLYFEAGRHLSTSHHKEDLSAICREIGRQLTTH